jgi:hypothetical protein
MPKRQTVLDGNPETKGNERSQNVCVERREEIKFMNATVSIQSSPVPSQPASDPSLALAFAEFAAGLTHGAIPAEVREPALWDIADTNGVCIAGASPGEESGQAARRLAAKWKSPGRSTILGIGSSMRPEAVALINGTLAQALEIGDKHASSLARPARP